MARKPRSPKQPRALEVETQAIQPYYRAGLYAELQKFGYSKKTRQLLLGEDSDLQSENQILEIYGLDLTVSEDRALHAVQILMDKTGYKGNIPGDYIQSSEFKDNYYLPKLTMTRSEYYQAYGLKRAGDGRYHGAQVKEALDGLSGLAKSRKIYYKRDKYVGDGQDRRQLHHVIRVTTPLILLIEDFDNLETEEAESLIAGQDIPKRNATITIQFMPLLVDQIEDFYLLKPSAMYTGIQAHYPNRRIPPAVERLASWLLTLDKPVFHPSGQELATKLRLGYLLQQRKWTLLDQKLQEALQICKEEGYLLSYEIKQYSNKDSLIELRLNPEVCKKIRPEEPGQKRRRRKHEEDSSQSV